jgi:hypothetical protein
MNVLREIAAVPDLDPRVDGVVKHKGRNPNCPQHVADVNGQVHAGEGRRRAGGHRVTEVARQSFDLFVARAWARLPRRRFEAFLATAEVGRHVGDRLEDLPLVVAPGIVGCAGFFCH